jgi:hypothetical protein
VFATATPTRTRSPALCAVTAIRAVAGTPYFKALETRFVTTCRNRPQSPHNQKADDGKSKTQCSSVASIARAAPSAASRSSNISAFNVIKPRSIREKSRTSSTMARNCSAHPYSCRTNKRSRAAIAPAGASFRIVQSPTTPFNGLRISWLKVAKKFSRAFCASRNCDVRSSTNCSSSRARRRNWRVRHRTAP